MVRIYVTALLMCAGSLFAAAAPSREQAASVGQAKAVMARLPLRFEENRGQLPPSVRFMARSGGGNLQLTGQGPVFFVGSAPVQLTLVHSNPAAAIEPLDRFPTDTNYMVGPRDHWLSGIGNYAKVRYSSVYPGIDVLYYGNQNQLEYDFLLAPGANPDAVRLQVSGDAQVFINAAGDLVLASNGAQVIQKAPVVYQQGRKIASRYTLLAHNQVGFRLQAYDRARLLVIDPILVYANYYGTSGTDKIAAIKMGPGGQLYLVGSTTTAEFISTANAYQSLTDGLTDIFLAIVDTTAAGNFSILYFTYLGGTNLDIPLDMALNPTGVAYIVGTTTSTDFPMAGNSISTSGAATNATGFVALLDPTIAGSGDLIYSTYLGGTTGNDAINGIALDPNNSNLMYVIGTTASADFPLTDSAYAPVLYGSQDAFLCKLDITNPAPIYSTYLGGELEDQGHSIALGTNGLVYFAATTDSTLFPLEGRSYSRTLKGVVGAVVGVMDMTKSNEASLVYSSYFGGSDTDEPRKIALDSNNNLIVTGYTLSSDFPVTADAVQRIAPGNTDVFLSILNPNANDPAQFIVYSTYFGGSQGEVPYDVQPDSHGNIYITGYTLSPDLYTVNAPQPGWASGTDLFVAAIRPGVPGLAGIVFSTYLGGAGTYVGNSLVIGSDGSIYVAGYGTLGLPGALGWAGGNSDGFLVVMK
jgi:hypothetical protein